MSTTTPHPSADHVGDGNKMVSQDGKPDRLHLAAVELARKQAVEIYRLLDELAALRAAPAVEPATCSWAQEDDDSGTWFPSCAKGLFGLNEGGPTDNGMKFCCFCSRDILEVPWQEPADDEGGAA